MSYIHQTQYKEKFQKDLYIKQKLEIGDSFTPWKPQVDIVLKSIVCDLSDTASGTGNTIIRIWKNKGHASEAIIFDAVFAANDVVQETSSIFSYLVNAGEKITYSVIQVTSGDSGGEAIISFVYENA